MQNKVYSSAQGSVGFWVDKYHQPADKTSVSAILKGSWAHCKILGFDQTLDRAG